MKLPGIRPKATPSQPTPFQLVQEAEQLHNRLLKHQPVPGDKLERLVQRSRARYLRRVEMLVQSSVWHRMIAYRRKARLKADSLTEFSHPNTQKTPGKEE